MGIIIALANQKGGVAKTTSAHNIAVALSMRGKKVLMVDMDSQASLTISTGIEPNDIADNCIVSVLTDDETVHKDIKECIHPTRNKGCYILPSIIDLADIEFRMIARVSREKILSRALESIRDEYDFIIIDCPPQLSILTINSLSCADGVLIPVKTDYLAYRGLTHLKDTIADIQELINPNLNIFGVIATIFDKRTKDDIAILTELNRENNLVAVINKKVIAKKGIYNGIAAVELEPNADISQAYMEIADMIIAGKYERKAESLNA